MSTTTVIAVAAGIAVGAAAAAAALRYWTLRAGRGEPALALAQSRAERLHRLATALSRAADPGEVGGAFLDEALDHLGAHGGSLVLRSEDGLALELVAGRDLPGAKARLLARIPIAEHFSVTTAYRTGEPAAARTYDELRERFPTSAETFGTQAKAIYALPLWVGGEPAGAFNLFFTHEHEVTAADADFLATMAQLCGQALERALLVQAESLAREQRRGSGTLRDEPLLARHAPRELAHADGCRSDGHARGDRRARRGGCGRRPDRPRAARGGAPHRRRVPRACTRVPAPLQPRRSDPGGRGGARIRAGVRAHPRGARRAVPGAPARARRRLGRDRRSAADRRRPTRSACSSCATPANASSRPTSAASCARSPTTARRRSTAPACTPTPSAGPSARGSCWRSRTRSTPGRTTAIAPMPCSARSCPRLADYASIEAVDAEGAPVSIAARRAAAVSTKRAAELRRAAAATVTRVRESGRARTRRDRRRRGGRRVLLRRASDAPARTRPMCCS